MVIRSGFGLSTRKDIGLVKRPIKVQEAIKAEQRKEFNELAPKIIAAYNERVSNWSDKTKPGFSKMVRDAGDGKKMSLFIFTTGDDHQKKTFAMLDSKGRKSGRIYSPKRKMKFKKNYFSKTAPVDVYGRRVRRSGQMQYRWFVDHPGIEPRGFSESILKEFNKDFKNAARRGFRAGMQRVTKLK